MRRELPVAARLGGFAAVLVAAFACAYAVGTAFDDDSPAGTTVEKPAPAVVHDGADHTAEPLPTRVQPGHDN
ncbi:hypothetical protein [Motilibacter deserti]|uniref:Lipoprotein n=1 Tax=Motilibacter deserti TaxID=2714956 RepID=A0ABX0GY76_9ACTN|nr:hypothetical protein [Motilibacter deserti]NHC15550.1 hypothetical protein [Motilibacter deserti]